MRKQLFGLLAEHGMSVVAADDAADAIARVNAMDAPPDLVLVASTPTARNTARWSQSAMIRV